LNPLGNQYFFRPNHLHKPFDNPKVRQALWYAFNQKDFLQAVIGNSDYYKPCKAMFVCSTALASEKGMDGLLESNFEKAHDILKEAGYDGTPIVLLHSTDLFVLTNLAPVAKSLMERAGFKVDMQSMDWQTLLSRINKKEPPNSGGWNAFLSSYVSADVLNPVMTRTLNAGCEKVPVPGWPCDQEMEKLRDQFARETDPAKQKQIADVTPVVLGGAEIAQPRMRLGRQAFQQGGRKPGFADAGLAREQLHLAFPGLYPRPAPQQPFQFLLPPDERGQPARPQRLEAALDGPRPQRRPGRHRPRDALEIHGP
jgi:hypothetical protein